MSNPSSQAREQSPGGRAGAVRPCSVARGEIDISSVRHLHVAALSAVAAAEPRPDEPVTLTLDWEQVTFLDSSGFHVLSDLHAEGLERGWRLELVMPSAPAPAHLLRLAARR